MQVSVVSVAKPWAYCSEPFHIMEQGVVAHSPHVQLALGGLCTEAIREEAIQPKRVS
jgi:hypothetical protein